MSAPITSIHNNTSLIDCDLNPSWIKRLSLFCKSKLHPFKQNLTTTHVADDRLSTKYTNDEYIVQETTFLPLSAIDADAIYQEASSSSSATTVNSPLLSTLPNTINKGSPDSNATTTWEPAYDNKLEMTTVTDQVNHLLGAKTQGIKHQRHKQHQQQRHQQNQRSLTLEGMENTHSRTVTHHTSFPPDSSHHSSLSTISGMVDQKDSIYSACNKQPTTPPSLHQSYPTTHSSINTLLPSTSTTDTPLSSELLAKMFWTGEQTICDNEEVATWLGTNNTLCLDVLQNYMNHFDFTNEPLDDAFRILCGKLFFKAESQQIDRIIEAFAKRFWECNPIGLYHSADVVYAISYSLLLLNTDLYGVKEHHRKMKRSRFVRNTKDTITSLVLSTQFSQLSFDPTYDTSSAKLMDNVDLPTETMTRTKSLSDRRRLRTSKSNHSLALSYASLKRSYLWRHGGSSFRQHQQDNDGNEKMIQAIGDGDLQCRTEKSVPKSRSLVDLSRYRQKTAPPLMKDQYFTTEQQYWMDNMDQLLKNLYTSIKSREITYLPSTATVDFPPSHSEQNSILTKKIIRRKRGQSEPSPTSATALLDRQTLDRNGNSLSDPSLALSVHQQNDSDKSGGNTAFPKDKAASGNEWDLEMNDMEGWVMQKCQTQGRRWRIGYMKLHHSILVIQYCDRWILPGQHWLDMIKQPYGSPHWFSLLDDDQNCKSIRALLNKQDTFKLNHSLSRILPHKQWTHVVNLQLADGNHWLFKVPSNQHAQEWTRALNYKAALYSKETSLEAVTNMDYGWNPANDTSPPVASWEAPMTCMISNQQSAMDRQDSIQRHIERLAYHVLHHRELRSLVEKRLSPRILTNWDLKLRYLLTEQCKYQTYQTILTYPPASL